MPRLPRPGRLFRNESGAFDLPSVLIGVAVVAILAVGVMALIFGAIPWAQNRAAAQDLAALTTAQGAAKAKDGGYVDPTRMDQLGYLSDDESLDYALSGDESCWVGVTKAKSGKHFYTINGSAPAELSRETKPGCLGGIKYEKISSSLNGRACGIAAGEVYCWGSVPVKIEGALTGKTVTDFSIGAHGSCAIDAEMALYCWGYRFTGDPAGIPVAINSGGLKGKKVSSVEVGEDATCAVAEEKLYCWGDGAGSRVKSLGDPAATPKSTVPLLIDGGELAGVRIKTAVIPVSSHRCALSVQGVAYCWGYAGNGEMGRGTEEYVDYPLPGAIDMSPVPGGSFSDIAGLFRAVCGLAEGTVYCWGDGFDGQVGAGKYQHRYTATAVGGLLTGKTMTHVQAVSGHACASSNDGNWFCWGENGWSGDVLGTGSSEPLYTPQALPISGELEGLSITALGLSDFFTCALADSAAYCRGPHPETGIDSPTYVRVPDPKSAKSWVDTVLDGGKLP